MVNERHDYFLENAEQHWAEYGSTHARVALEALPPERLARFRRDLLVEVATLMTPRGLLRVLAANFAYGRR